MPSPALIAWSTDSAAALSQLEADDRGPDERPRQLDYAYVLLLCAHFQAYCRGLHSDATQVLVESIAPEIGAILDANLLRSAARPAQRPARHNQSGFQSLRHRILGRRRGLGFTDLRTPPRA